MASNRDQDLQKRRIATKLALVTETDKAEYAEAVSMMKSLGYSDKDARVIASSIRAKYLPELKKQIVKSESMMDDVLPGSMSKTPMKTTPEAIDGEEGIDEGADEGFDEELGDLDFSEEGPADDLGVEPDKGPEVEFKGEADATNLAEGETLEIEMPHGLGKLKLSLETDNAEDIEPIEEEMEPDLDLGADLGAEEEMEPEVEEVEEEEIAMPKEAMRKVSKTEDVKPEDRGHGDDTENMSMGQKPKALATDGTHAVAAPGEKAKSMTLKGTNPDEGENPDFLFFEVPTAMLDDRFLNPGAKGKLSLDGAGGELVEQFSQLNLDKGTSVPTQGGEKDSMGWEKPTGEFEIPTQNTKMTTERKTTVAQFNDFDLEDDDEFPMFEKKARPGKLHDKVPGKFDLDEELGFGAPEEDLELGLGEDELEDEFLPEENYVDEGPALFAFRKQLLMSKHASKIFAENDDKEILRNKVANKECDACDNDHKLRVAAVSCKACGAKVVLCEADLNEEYCPGCASIDMIAARMATQAAVSQELVADYGGEGCVAEGQSVTNDVNGDGGFRTKGEYGEPEEDKAVSKEAQVEIMRYKQALKEEKLRNARREAAVDAAWRMVAAGVIAEDEIEKTIATFVDDNLSVSAIKNTSDNVVRMAQNLQKERIRTASVKTGEPHQYGVARSFTVASSQEVPAKTDLQSALSGILTRPNPNDYDEITGRLIRR